MDLSSVPKEWLLAALGVVGTTAAAQGARGWFVRFQRRRRIHAQLARAGDGERAAVRYLQDAGFTILGTQVAGAYTLEVDGEAVTVAVRADVLVERDGRRWVVEVKSGRFAPRVDHAATRRQLLEYRLAFDVDGVLLFDAEAMALRAVTFPDVGHAPRPGTWYVFVALALALAGVAGWAAHAFAPP